MSLVKRNRGVPIAGIIPAMAALVAMGQIAPVRAASLRTTGENGAPQSLLALRPAGQWVPVKAVPHETDAPFFHTDWSLGLRGAYSADQGGGRYQTQILPSVSVTHNGPLVDLSAGASAQISRDGGDGNGRIESLGGNASVNLKLSRDANLDTSASLTLSQQNASDPQVATNIATPPIEALGTLETNYAQKFGKLTATLRGKLTRDVYGNSTLVDASTQSNISDNVTSFGTGLRLAYQLTPVVGVFADGGVTRQVFDAASVDLGLKLDGDSYALKAGVFANWGDMLLAQASVGAGLERFDDTSLGDVRATLYDASVTYRPSTTLTLKGNFSTSISPPGTNGSGTARVDYAAAVTAQYLINQWLDLRASAGWHDASFSDSSNTDRGYDLGVGADYKLSGHTSLSADYGFYHASVSPSPDVDTHTVTLGVTFSK